MNAKVEQSENSVANAAKLIAAVLIVAAGIAGFYLLPDVAVALRTVGLIVVFGIALAIFALTAQGRAAREYVSESHFELRKVVWPTRQETLQTTLVIVIVVIVLSLILWLIDMLLGWVILENLLKAG
jgi:preprotein translocase subunit SecE